MIDREARLIVTIIYTVIVVGYLASTGAYAYGSGYYELAVERSGCGQPVTTPIIDSSGSKLCFYVSNRGGKAEIFAIEVQIYNSTRIVYEDTLYTLLLPGHDGRVEASLPPLPPGSYNLSAVLLHYENGGLEPAGPRVLVKLVSGTPNGRS